MCALAAELMLDGVELLAREAMDGRSYHSKPTRDRHELVHTSAPHRDGATLGVSARGGACAPRCA